jgi:hypothetical protein
MLISSSRGRATIRYLITSSFAMGAATIKDCLASCAARWQNSLGSVRGDK